MLESSTSLPVSFQVELFRDGRIRITYGDIPPITAETGLSRGNPESWSTAYSDLSAAVDSGVNIVADQIADDGVVVDVSVAWTSQPGVIYNVLRSDDFAVWKKIAEIPGSPGTATVWAVTGQKQRRAYYKIERTSITAAP